MTPVRAAWIVLAGWVPSVLGALGFGYSEPVLAAEMAFSRTGVIDAILVEEGDLVESGQVLARLDAANLAAELRTARERTRLQELRIGKLRELFEKGSIPMEEFERARADAAIAGYEVERIEALQAMHTLVAPFDGVVVRVHREVSESAIAAQTIVISLVNLDRLKLVLNLSPEYVESAGMSVGDPVELLEVTSGEIRQGTVRFVSPVIDAASNTIRTVFEIDNRDRELRSGQEYRLAAR